MTTVSEYYKLEQEVKRIKDENKYLLSLTCEDIINLKEKAKCYDIVKDENIIVWGSFHKLGEENKQLKEDLEWVSNWSKIQNEWVSNWSKIQNERITKLRDKLEKIEEWVNDDYPYGIDGLEIIKLKAILKDV